MAERSVPVSQGVLGGGVESWITLASYIMGQKLRCLILNPLQQLPEIGIIYPTYNEGGSVLMLTRVT